MAQLERENREQRRANTILRSMSASCGGARPRTQQVIDFIDAHRAAFGVEPICTVLAEAD
jgi:hypothetical protein